MSITVTKPFLPPVEEYKQLVDGIWRREWLTNHGPLVNRLEGELKEKLDVSGLLYVTNGTVALQLAIKALRLTGEIITTPFSYVATTSTICWEGCKPVMADIDPETLNIDARSIERCITEHTSAIMATHVYGNPCNVDAIQQVADKHRLKVIYDGAHAFGTKYKGKSVFKFGDISTASFHATKLFHTVEGGAVVSEDAATLAVLAQMRNFGHVSASEFEEVGINGKNSELHAGMGICNLKYIDEILARRKSLSLLYNEKLAGLKIVRPKLLAESEFNYAYYPVLFESEAILLKVVDALALYSITPRRYFFPSLADLPYVEQGHRAPHAADISSRVLCLPLYHSLSEEEVELVSQVIRKAMLN